MTALDRAIARPPRVPGVVRHSPLAGLDRRSLGFPDVLAQSLSATAPAAAATTIPVLVAQQSNGGALWAVAGALALSLLVASTVNQFTRRMSAAGSLYTFVSKGLGTAAGFVTGIGMLVAYAVLTMFALTGAAVFAATVFRVALPGPAAVLPPGNGLVAIIVVVLASAMLAVLARGIRMSARLTLVIESASVALIVASIVAVAVAAASADGADGGRSGWSAVASTPSDAGGFVTSMVIAMMAFVGFESAASVGVEAKRPFASIPRALTWTVIGCGAVYLLSTYSQLVGFSSLGSALSESTSPVADLAAGYGVEWMGVLLDVSIAASFTACAVASATALVRVVFAMSRDGLLLEGLSGTHPRLGSPMIALCSTVPAIALLAVGVLQTTPDATSALSVMLVASASGFLASYALVCVAAFAFLRRIGELGVLSGITALGASALLAGALGVYLVIQLQGAGAVGVIIFLGAMGAGLATFPVLRSRRPWIEHSMGQFDETTLHDVLGGPDAGDRHGGPAVHR